MTATSSQPIPYPILHSRRGRPFDCYPVALQAVIVDPTDRVLLLSSPHKNPNGAWQVVSGALQASETILDGTLREVAEETGLTQLRPLGAYHVQTFAFDEAVPFMIATYYLFLYQGGQVIPGDDMAGSRFGWFTLPEIEAPSIKLVVPPEKWIIRRGVQLVSAWQAEEVALQSKLGNTIK